VGLHPQEASVRTGGERLGAVGGRFVAKVFIGVLRLDNDSYLSEKPRWWPVLPRSDGRHAQDDRPLDVLGRRPTSGGL
jgi:hypothetical protein